ncbi:uncharacterized protein ACA1_373780 [Acanthamoeba castellanii str. Neff]|uniref:Uncharacterized protein n=1 Tax=Acanthamoeba castellanii (strain ATCC 30010 / Neff) TaxID=1257118 RepID=L8GHS4_ACACF|nr:uncharacterized protein ACA1_373780 [Acanthamoeba castellanii str. Neff]ELR12313.1 hypothetical protein ACA1_373780 [Acanthamoeba castellanii str. Neff]
MKLHIVLFALVILGLLATARRGANLLWDEAESRVVGFDVGLCTWTPAVNNTGPLYNLCNTVHSSTTGLIK